MNIFPLKTLIRSMLNNKLLTGIQIGGLVIGFTIVIFILVKIKYEYSYDTFWKDSPSIYRLGLDLSYEDGRLYRSARNFEGSSELLKAEIPGIVSQCNLGRDVITVYDHDKVIQNVDWFWSDTTFFSVFERKILYKESNQLFGDIHGIAISESFAKKLFGNEDPLNKEITLNEGWKFLVKSVFEDIPVNSHIKVDVLGSYQSLYYYMRNFDNRTQTLIENPGFAYQKASPYTQSRWSSPTQFRPHCYIRLEPNVDIATVKSATLPAIKKVGLPPNLEKSNINFIFQPIESIHLHSNLNDELNANGSTMQVNFLIIIAMVILVVCIVNYLNLSTISAIEERKSYSIRILNGSNKISVFASLLLKNLILYSLALLISAQIAAVIIPLQLPPQTISGLIFLVMLSIVGLGALISTLIPYLLVFSTPIFLSLKGQSVALNQHFSGRKALVVMQFTISIILIICTIGIFKQMDFVMKEKLGFSGQQTLFSYTPMTMTNSPEIPSKLLTFKNEVLALSGVSSFSVSSSVPGKEIRRIQDNVLPGNSAEPFSSPFNEISIDDYFLKTYGIPVIAGKNIEEKANWTSDDVIINRCASETMGYKKPEEAIESVFRIGQNTFKVKGVVENYHHVSLHYPVKPSIYFQNLQWEMSVGYYSFKLNTSNISGTMKEIESIWKKLYPKDEFIYFFSNKEFESQYQNDLNFKNILTTSALLALIISCMGLLSLAIFATKRRTKEIGIRKVNGAKVSEVLTMLNKDFVKWVAIAFLLATPISWYAIHTWLESFAYRTTMSWWIFALAGLLALGIALLTVSWQSWKAATRNPVEALRYE
ncbi:MAG TPA: FtsX-like permease family protein [Prolixibacteraceae bacterium]